MRTIVLSFEGMLRLVDESHNAPTIRDQADENLFQSEIRDLYDSLIGSLTAFGLEGDYYGVSDYAVRPDLRARPTTGAPPAPHTREFAITILEKKFFESRYLEVVHEFLSKEARRYRVQIAQHFDQSWHLAMFLTAELAKIHCTNDTELTHLRTILAKI